jgi:hypothetical protein
VARQYVTYPEGTPQRDLQDAVARTFPTRIADFFDEVGRRASVTSKSASGTFYAFLRGRRPLPADQRAVYLKLLPVKAQVLDAIRPPARVREADVPLPEGQRGSLAALQATVARLAQAVESLGARVDELERRPSGRARRTTAGDRGR